MKDKDALIKAIVLAVNGATYDSIGGHVEFDNYDALEIIDLCATYQDECSNVNELKNAFTIGYELGHNDTVESNYCDAEERFNDAVEDGSISYQDEWISGLKIKATARLSSAMAQSDQAKSSEYEATQEGRIRELHWLIDELDPPQPPTSKNNEA